MKSAVSQLSQSLAGRRLKKTEDVKVSVVVPVYNQEVYLREALDSLKAQTLKDIEFIIINDGSTDKSIDIINEYAKEDARFVVVDKENGGVASAINTGNRMARGEYLAEMDSDDYVAPEMYEKMYAIAKKHDLDILKSNVINFTGTGESYKGVTEKIAPQGYFGRIINPHEDNTVFSFPMYAWVSLYKRKLILDNDITWNEGVSSYNDNGFYWQTMSLAQRVMYIDEGFIYHRRDNEMSTVKNPDKMFRNFFVEHAFIKEVLKARGVFEEIKAYFFERKIQNYYFALNIIPYEKKQEFFRLIAEDFRKDIAEDGLNDVDFINPRNKVKITEIVNNPDHYFFSVYLPDAYKVSVIIPIHNAESFLRNTLERLINQSLRTVEFILVENGSTDRTVEIIKEYKNKDPRITAVSIGVSNAGRARNVGLSMAHGQYVIFLDADDEYDTRLLEKTYNAAVKDKADVVWFNSQEKNARNGLTKPHTHAYRKSSFPEKRPFPFKDIKGNPFDSFIGWPWDKLYSMKYIRTNHFVYQEIDVSNDGYFNFLAMAKAQRITTLDDVLVTRVVEHGHNISSNRHDLNPDNQIGMITAIYEKLKLMKDGGKAARAFAERSIRSIVWLFTTGFKTKDGASRYFDLLVGGALQRLEIDKLSEDEVAEKRRSNHEKLLGMMHYKPGEYERFIGEVGGSDFELAQTEILSSYTPNVQLQDRSARLIFGQAHQQGQGKSKPWFNIIIGNVDTSNATVVIDFIYMGHFKEVVRDTLNLSIALHQQRDGKLRSVVHQAEWDTGEKEMIENIFYTFAGNIFTIHAKYPDRYTGFEYKIRNISTREGTINFSVVNVAKGYDQGLLFERGTDLIPIRNVKLALRSGGRRTVFRTQNAGNVGQDLMMIELKPYQFNNVVFSIDVTKVPNNKPVVHDTLYLGLYMEPADDKPRVKVFQAEWLHGRNGLKDHLYYYIKDDKLYLGARYYEQWAGYNFKVNGIMGREAERDYAVHKIAPELIDYTLAEIPEQAVVINDVMED